MIKRKLAIVIPFYKRAYFTETLESLRNQTDKNFTVYIGNDGSKDKVLDLIQEYKTHFNLEYKEFSHIGYKHLSRHWDRCVAMIKEENWFQILGDDDVLAPNFVDVVTNLILKQNNISSNLISVSRRLINGSGELIDYPVPFKKNGKHSSKEFFFEKLRGTRSMTLSEHVFSVEAYNKFGFQDFPVAFGTDDVAFLRYTDMGDFYYCNDTYVNIRISPKQLSSVDDEKIYRSRVQGLKESKEYVLKEFSSQLSFLDKLKIILYMAKIERNPTKMPYYLGVHLPKIFIQSYLN